MKALERRAMLAAALPALALAGCAGLGGTSVPSVGFPRGAFLATMRVLDHAWSTLYTILTVMLGAPKIQGARVRVTAAHRARLGLVVDDPTGKQLLDAAVKFDTAWQEAMTAFIQAVGSAKDGGIISADGLQTLKGLLEEIAGLIGPLLPFLLAA